MLALSLWTLAASATTIAYGVDPLQTVDVYAPSSSSSPKEAHPIAVFLHGGVWQHGERTDFADVGQALAARGFVAFIASYRLAPSSKWPAQAEDAASVVDVALKEAARFGGDPKRLVLIGHSAGAQMASMLVYDDAFLARVHRAPKDVRALVLLSGVFDLKKPLDEAQADGGFRAFIAPVFAVDDLVRASPIKVARKLAIPIVIATGERDYQAMRAQTFSMNEKLRALQETVTLVDAPRANHDELPTAPAVLDAIANVAAITASPSR